MRIQGFSFRMRSQLTQDVFPCLQNLTEKMIGRCLKALGVLILKTWRIPSQSFSEDIIAQGINNQRQRQSIDTIYIQLNNIHNMAHLKVIQNTFEQKELKQLLKQIEFVSFDQPSQTVIQQIEELSSKQYLWAIGKNPAYFVQYQVKSAAVLKALDHVLIVWKPKYLQYPSMIRFPELKQKKLNNMTLQFSKDTTTTADTNELITKFVSNFYGTYFHSDPDFETNLVTYSKHFISKISKHSYWHALVDDTEGLFITQKTKITNCCQIRIKGVKEGYDKTLLLFCYQGSRSSIFTMAKNKWMQIFSFLAMIAIFYSVVACEADSTEGICAYRHEMTLGGAGIMLALIGMRYGQKKQKKRPRKDVRGSTEMNKEQ